jgi:hypothetical protein
MRTTNCSQAAFLLLAISLPGAAVAADFDGSKNLICAAIDVVACTEDSQGPICTQGHARTFDLAEFFTINFRKKEIRATGNNISEVSPILNQEKTDTQIFMQGVEHERGWTATLDQADGTLTLSVSGQDVSFVIFGACTAP